MYKVLIADTPEELSDLVTEKVDKYCYQLLGGLVIVPPDPMYPVTRFAQVVNGGEEPEEEEASEPAGRWITTQTVR